MLIDWKKYLRYEDGKLYWLPREGKDRYTKAWNTRFSDKEVGWWHTHGYRVFSFSITGKNYLTHRVIWELYYGEIPDGMEIDHINFDRADNHIDNLQLVTHQQNLDRKNQTSKGYRMGSKTNITRPYHACRTDKHFGTACGAYMSYATAFVQGDSNGDSR